MSAKGRLFLPVRALWIDLVDRAQGKKRRLGGVLDRLRSPGQPVTDRQDPADLVALRLHGLQRPDGRAARRHDVLDDHAALAGLERWSLDTPEEAVLLGLLTHEEGLDRGASGERGTGDRVGAHRHTADRGGTPLAGLGGYKRRERVEPIWAEDRALGIDEVLGGD